MTVILRVLEVYLLISGVATFGAGVAAIAMGTAGGAASVALGVVVLAIGVVTLRVYAHVIRTAEAAAADVFAKAIKARPAGRVSKSVSKPGRRRKGRR